VATECYFALGDIREKLLSKKVRAMLYNFQLLTGKKKLQIHKMRQS
jgi:hypothetical protein